MQQAKQMTENIAGVEQELNNTFVTGKSLSNLVEVVMNCKGEFESVKIDEVTLNDKAMLQDLILIALRDARSQANEQTTEKMKQATGGIESSNASVKPVTAFIAPGPDVTSATPKPYQLNGHNLQRREVRLVRGEPKYV